MTVIEHRTMEAIQSINRKIKDAIQIDWEQRRYEIAKEVLAGIVSRICDCVPVTPYEDVAEDAVAYTDALISELKKTTK